MNGFIMADELSIFDLTEADGRAAVIAWGKTVTTGVSWKSQAYQLSVSHTHTHTQLYLCSNWIILLLRSSGKCVFIPVRCSDTIFIMS